MNPESLNSKSDILYQSILQCLWGVDLTTFPSHSIRLIAPVNVFILSLGTVRSSLNLVFSGKRTVRIDKSAGSRYISGLELKYLFFTG